MSGPIRVIRIAGIDNNMCCGTHVSNLADLQLVKLLRSEKVKKTTRVHFVAGLRALEYFGELATQVSPDNCGGFRGWGGLPCDRC